MKVDRLKQEWGTSAGLNEWVSEESELDYNSCLASINEDSVNERYEEQITFPEYLETIKNMPSDRELEPVPA